MPLQKTAQEVNNEIRDITVPLAQALRTLADNIKGTQEGREKAKINADVVDGFNKQSQQLMNQLTQTQTASMGMGRGGSRSSTSDQDDRN